MEGVPNWKLTSENQHTFLMAYQNKFICLMLPTLKHPTFTFTSTQGHQKWV